jgi:hypothetical protein
MISLVEAGMAANAWIKVAVLLLWVGVLMGCLENVSAPTQPTPKPTNPATPIDSIPTSESAHPDTITRSWIMPYPRGTPDSDLVGDFAPVALGNTWIYYQSRIRVRSTGTQADTEWVARVEASIISVEPSDTGRLVRVRVDEKPISTRCSLTSSGKTWRWDEAPGDSAITVEKLYLEKGDGFFQFGSDGKWRPAAPGYGLQFHRVQKFYTYLDPDSPWKDTLGVPPQPSRIAFLKNVGLVKMDTSDSQHNAMATRANLVSFNGRIFLDSLNRELTRPFIPKDSLLGQVTLEDVKASLPKDYCNEPGPNLVADPNQALYDWVDIKPGKTWEYLASESQSSSAAWYAGRSDLYQGLSRISVTGTLISGTCTFFGFRETDSLFHGESWSRDGFETTTSSLAPKVSSVMVYGVKRGAGVYRWVMTGSTGSLDTLQPGLDRNGALWPFASGLAGIAEGVKDSTYPIVRSLADSDVGTMRSLVYSYKTLYDPPAPVIDFKFVKGLGVAYSETDPFSYPGSLAYSWKRELIRQNGRVIDTSALARYQAIIPTHP